MLLLRLLQWLIDWLFGWLRKRPSRLRTFKAEHTEMSNVRISWTLPTPTSRQRPISYVRIEARVDGVSEWSEIDTVPPTRTDLVVEDIAPGRWHFRGIVVDTADRESAPREASIDVPFDPPSALVDFRVSLVE